MNLQDFIIPIITSVFSAAVAWGILHTKVDRLEKTVDKLEEDSKDYIKYQHFSEVTRELRDGISNLQSLMNQILIQLSKGAN